MAYFSETYYHYHRIVMKNSSLTNTQEQLNGTTSSFNNPASLKGKLQSLEVKTYIFRHK